MNLLTINLLFSTFVFWVAARIYVLPTLEELSPRAVLLPILLLHSFRHLGLRIFFLHDGRTTDLVVAIEAHASRGDTRYPASEANAVIARFRRLGRAEQEDLFNFLRSL